MELKTRKIIAREGLIVLAIFILAIIANNSLISDSNDRNWYIFLGYNICLGLVLRFIVWAIMTLFRKTE